MPSGPSCSPPEALGGARVSCDGSAPSAERFPHSASPPRLGHEEEPLGAGARHRQQGCARSNLAVGRPRCCLWFHRARGRSRLRPVSPGAFRARSRVRWRAHLLLRWHGLECDTLRTVHICGLASPQAVTREAHRPRKSPTLANSPWRSRRGDSAGHWPRCGRRCPLRGNSERSLGRAGSSLRPRRRASYRCAPDRLRLGRPPRVW